MLKKNIRAKCKSAEYEQLPKIDKGILNKILSKGNFKPHKVSYYLERWDSEFDVKIANVLQVYKEIPLVNDTKLDLPNATALSYD